MNPDINWIILINPPFATSQPGKLQKGDYKSDVSNTKIRTLMHKEDLGEVSRELFAQFIFRIRKEFHNKKTHLCLFSKIKYFNSNNDQKLRDKIFDFTFKKGFIFSSVNFSGTSRNSQFPVGFMIWDLYNKNKIEEQNIVIDIFNEDVEKIGTKNIIVEHRDKFLNKWIKRPKCNIIFPPFASNINIRYEGTDIRNRICEDFIGSLMCCGNDLQQQNLTALFSGPQSSAGSHSITPEIFEKSMVVHAVRRIPKANWLNDRDQFMQPNIDLSQYFIVDCVIWSLFSNSNETVALKNINYQNNIYQIKNHFFPFKVDQLNKWNITDKEISNSFKNDNDRFVAKWLEGKDLSIESQNVYDNAKSVYIFYFENLYNLRTQKYKIHTWDAGWWQIRNVLADNNMGNELLLKLKESHNVLKDKLLKDISSHGFIS